MTNKERLLIVAVFVIALVGGGILAMNLLGGGGDGGATPSPAAVASGSPTPTPPLTAPPIESPSATAEPSAPASPEPSPSTSPGPSVAPGEPATIVLSGLKLDAKDDPAGKDRSIGFRTDGTGDVTASVSAVSPQGNVVMCLGAGGGQLDCTPTASGVLSAVAPDGGGDFVLTLRGEGVEAPIVDVTITFPATAPAVIIAGARFDGTLYPETNGITATVTPRRNGDLTLAADWAATRSCTRSSFVSRAAREAWCWRTRARRRAWRRHGRSPLPTGGRWPCGTPKTGSDPRRWTRRSPGPDLRRGAVQALSRAPTGGRRDGTIVAVRRDRRSMVRPRAGPQSEGTFRGLSRPGTVPAMPPPLSRPECPSTVLPEPSPPRASSW